MPLGSLVRLLLPGSSNLGPRVGQGAPTEYVVTSVISLDVGMPQEKMLLFACLLSSLLVSASGLFAATAAAVLH